MCHLTLHRNMHTKFGMIWTYSDKVMLWTRKSGHRRRRKYSLQKLAPLFDKLFDVHIMQRSCLTICHVRSESIANFMLITLIVFKSYYLIYKFDENSKLQRGISKKKYRFQINNCILSCQSSIPSFMLISMIVFE